MGSATIIIRPAALAKTTMKTTTGTRNTRPPMTVILKKWMPPFLELMSGLRCHFGSDRLIRWKFQDARYTNNFVRAGF